MNVSVNWSESRVPEEFQQSRTQYVRPFIEHRAIVRYEQALRTREESPLIIGICGDVGTGKTTIAVELLRAAQCFRIRYTTMENMLRAADTRFNWEGYREEFELPSVMVIDDLNNASQPWRHRNFIETVLARHNARRWTILVATCTVEEFSGILGPSVADRMFNPVLVLKGKSYRQK